MKSKAAGLVLTTLVSVIVLAMSGCFGIPKNTTPNAMVGKTQLHATGAGIVKADAQKTTFKIKCTRCGFEPDEITIDTPVEGRPYTLDWVCPKCGNKQKIVIQVAGP